MRRANFESVSGTDWAIRSFGENPTRTAALLKAAWPVVVGADLARRTEVLALRDGALHVRVPDVQWIEVLHNMRGDILSRLRLIVGSLAPYRFVLLPGGSSVITSPLAAPLKNQSPGTLSPSLEAQAEIISDLEIRTLFCKTAARYLGSIKKAGETKKFEA